MQTTSVLLFIAFAVTGCGSSEDTTGGATGPGAGSPSASGGTPAMEEAPPPTPPAEPAAVPTADAPTPAGGYTGHQLPSLAMPYAAGDTVWAGFATSDDWSSWNYGRVRFVAAEGNHAKINAAFQDRLTPSAFVSAATPVSAVTPGATVLVSTAFSQYGRVVSVTGENADVATGVGAAYRPGSRQISQLRAIEPNTWTPGHPVAISEGEQRYACILLFANAEKAWGLCGRALREAPRAQAHLIDPTARHATGASVLAQPMSGMGTLSMVAGQITAVLNDGFAYTVSREGGTTFDTGWSSVMAAP
jgi:hypothetical protein